MNSLELRAVLDTFIEVSKISTWREIKIYFSGTYYTVVEGKIPYSFAKFMLKKYSKYRHDIRVHGNSGNEIYEKKYLKKDELGNPYVDCYHIDTKEGLIYFLSEYDYYFNQVICTEKLRKKLYRKQKEIIARVNEKLLEKGNPYITTEQWLKDHFMRETGDFEYTNEILHYVKEFDSVINPFSAKYDMKNPLVYVDDITFTIFYDRKNSFRMIITSGNSKISHNRDIRGIDDYVTYTLSYCINENIAVEIHHYISANNNENVICLYKYNRNSFSSDNDKLDLRYDLLSNQSYSSYGEKSPITFEEIELIVSELKKAIVVAKKITIKNMVKK